MPKLFPCPTCKTDIWIHQESRGKKVRCPRCQVPFVSPVEEIGQEQNGARPEARAAAPKAPAAAAQGPAATGVMVQKVKAPAPPPAAKAQSQEREEFVEVKEIVEDPAPPPTLKKRRAEGDEFVEVRVEAPPIPIASVAADDEPRADDDDDDVPSINKPKKKKGKKKKRPVMTEQGTRATYLFWGVGFSIMFVIMLVLFCLAFFSPWGSERKAIAVYLLIMTPISMVLFFVAMYLASVWFGALEIGQIHVALFKAFFLTFVVNLVGILPGGWIFTTLVWLIGCFTIFKLDWIEAQILIGLNWLLNIGVTLLLFAAIMSWITGSGGFGGGGGFFGGDDDDDDFRPPINQNFNNFKKGKKFQPAPPPPQNAVWDIEDVEARGGVVDADPDNGQIRGIDFNGKDIQDADLAQMKNFPTMTKLDLGNTQVTDAGVLHLRNCPALREVILTGTQVTDEGVAELRKAMPKLKITR